MDILIADAGFNMLGGAERAARDLAASLIARGHRAAAFSTPIGAHATAVDNLGIPVIWDLRDLPFHPDVIHAQHHLDAMTAIVGLPGVPALFHCHGATFFDAVPVHPRILAYATVSSTLAIRIAAESGIAESDIAVVPNAVDLTRFGTVRVPPRVPQRAALFGNQIARTPLVNLIATVTARRGIELDFIGRSFGREVMDPETTLPRYDIVFASGKSAIDAMACGCAVIVIGLQGCGEMVGTANFDRLRAVNFTIPVNSASPVAAAIDAELGRYDADEVGAATRRLRAEAGLDRLVDAFERLYRDVIGRHAAAAADEPGERWATAAYLRRLSPLARALDGTEASHTSAALASRIDGMLSGCSSATM